MTSDSTDSDSLVEEPFLELAALWEALKSDFQSDKLHQAFLEACLERGNLGFAARAYRTVLDEARAGGDSAREERAAAQLDKLPTLAWTLLKSHAKPPRSYKRVTTWIAAGVCVLLLLGVALAFRL